MWALLTAAVFNIFPINTDWLGIKDISQNFLYVLIGCRISGLVTGTGKKYFNIVLGLLAFILSVVLYVITGGAQIIVINRLICILMQYAMLSLGLFLENYDCRTLKMVGRHPFTIYVYSWPVQAVVEMGMEVDYNLPW